MTLPNTSAAKKRACRGEVCLVLVAMGTTWWSSPLLGPARRAGRATVSQILATLSMSPRGTPSGSNQARTLPTLDAEQLGDFALAPAGAGLVVDRRSRRRGVPQVALPHIERHAGLGARSAESVPERMGMQMDCLGA